MLLSSPAFSDNEPVPVQFTCNGPNINPPLEFHDIPLGTRSLVLIVADLNAQPPWIHWFVYNIPPTTKFIPQGETPPGATEGLANGGTIGYEGPCPIYFKGKHHYLFLLHALNTVLDINPSSTYWDVQEMIERHTIEKAELVGTTDGSGEALHSNV